MRPGVVIEEVTDQEQVASSPVDNQAAEKKEGPSQRETREPEAAAEASGAPAEGEQGATVLAETSSIADSETVGRALKGRTSSLAQPGACTQHHHAL